VTTTAVPQPSSPSASKSDRRATGMLSIKQRDLAKTMRAARSAGIGAFELIDPATGLIFRATGDSGLTPTLDHLDAELREFEARRHG
jgi:hypothetical protein